MWWIKIFKNPFFKRLALLTDVEERAPRVGVATPERRVQFLVQLFADDDVEWRREHVL